MLPFKWKLSFNYLYLFTVFDFDERVAESDASNPHDLNFQVDDPSWIAKKNGWDMSSYGYDARW